MASCGERRAGIHKPAITLILLCWLLALALLPACTNPLRRPTRSDLTATQNAAQTATYAPRPDPLLLTATGIAVHMAETTAARATPTPAD